MRNKRKKGKKEGEKEGNLLLRTGKLGENRRETKESNRELEEGEEGG